MSIYRAASGTRHPRRCFNTTASSSRLQGCKKNIFSSKETGSERQRDLPENTHLSHSTKFPGFNSNQECQYSMSTLCVPGQASSPFHRLMKEETKAQEVEKLLKVTGSEWICPL